MSPEFIYNQETAVVTTRQGKIRGYVYKGISIFKGIPYATARRFHAPEPVEPWEGVMDATNYGYVCPLLELGKPNGELGVPHRYWVMNEDCQNLNVWTPAHAVEKRPVLVWLHGGGYEAGSAIEHVAYEGENMCREGQVVVVSINHRLNILGYFDLSAYGREYANSGNAGGDDIIAALKWIQENIAAFGGDPDNVTVFGQSGGGAKVTTLLQTPAADGLYARGINMSGVTGPLLADSKGDGKELAMAIMAELGIDDDIRELEKVPYAALAEAYKKVKPEFAAKGKYVGCTPCRNAFYMGTPDENGFREETAHIPMLIGTTYGEFAAVSAPSFNKEALTREEGIAQVEKELGKEAAAELLPLYETAYPERNPIDLLTLDFLFRLPGMQYICQRSGLNECTYSYLFNQDLPMNYKSVPGHCTDIPFVFHNTELVPSSQIPGVTEKLEKQIFDTIIAFAATGNPNNPSVPAWPASEPEAENTMIFDENTRLVTNHDRELVPLFAKYMGPVFMRRMAEVMGQVQH